MCFVTVELLPQQVASRLSRVKVNPQGLKGNLSRLWYGAEQAEQSQATKAESLLKSKSAQPEIVPSQAAKRPVINVSAQRVGEMPLSQKTNVFAARAKQFATQQPLKAAAAAISVVALAQQLADYALSIFNMALFDEELIPEQFSQAIVRIFNRNSRGKITSQGSACIVRSVQNPDLYFVLTAAHCLEDNEAQEIQVHDPRQPSRRFFIAIKPIVVDKNNDVAVLLILPEEIKKFKDEAGVDLPAISANQLSSIKPEKKEVAILQGYPGFIPDEEPSSYRKTLETRGPAIWPTRQEMSIHGEQFRSLPGPALPGASGSPIIQIKGGQPQVVAVHSTGESLLNKSTGRSIAVGAGTLPEYIQQAEKKHAEAAALAKETSASAPTFGNWLYGLLPIGK